MVLVAPTSVEHTSVPGLLATFLINGEAVPSYVNTEQKKVDKYPGVTMVRSIEAIPGANYSIKVETNADFESTCETLTVRVDIDGQEVGGWNCNLPNGVAHADGLNQKSLNGAEFFHKFRFASISKVEGYDGARIQEDIEAMSKMGQVHLMIYRVLILSASETLSRDSTPADAESEVSEKSLKGREVDCGTSYDTGVRVSGEKYSKVEYRDGIQKPIAVFIFNYKSRGALQREMIIPRDKTPDRLEAMSAEELRNLVRQQETALDALTESKIKLENNLGAAAGGTNSDATSAPAKRKLDTPPASPQLHKYKKFKTEEGHELFDLTD